MSDHKILDFACAVSAITPRGKGALARGIGRMLDNRAMGSLVTRHGAKLPIVPASLDVFVTMRSQDNAWDYWVFRAVNAMLETDGVFYDIGANVGYLSTEVAHLRLKDGVQVIAFEPQQSLAANIRAAAKENALQNLRVFQLALGDTNGSLAFSEKSHSIHGGVATKRDEHSYVVDAMTLDEAVAQFQLPPPDVIKIDVEGFEYAVLSGAKSLAIQHQPVIIFEISDGTSEYGWDAPMLGQLFDSFPCYHFFSVKGEKKSLSDLTVEAGTHTDILAVPAKRMERFFWFMDRYNDGTIDSYFDQ